ncbi:DUF3011 family protein [Stenotrophomonas maltophilia]|jgi:DUF3011 family protein|uniref:DUF3011 domain-containing protein n=1 Tax=Stenotrophomonas chelatiphaga TaxID=517011 RepID=UPI000F4BE4E3|nr:DUF3011 domain-containing protein [Stenotrophomonas chelatiphaga]MCS4231816.1 hypothetical protein [Stenotrophomonas chelatiphaga]ROQ41739.1 DUF3011 family protein [Stenotrophomonas maltophilia]
MKHQNKPWHSVGLACALLTGCSTAGYAQYADTLPAYPLDPSTTVEYAPPPPYNPYAETRPARPVVAPPYDYNPYAETVQIAPPADRSSQLVNCGSKDHRYVRCEVQLSHKDSVHLVQQQSRSPCVQGRDWGQDQGAIWVSNGCRATFRIERYYWR